LNGKKPNLAGHLASGGIDLQGKDTNILQEDLFHEVTQRQLDIGGGSFLIANNWVRFFDIDSSFLKGLMALLNSSTTLRSIIQNKATLSMGEGFVALEGGAVPVLVNLKKQTKKKVIEEEARLLEINNFLERVNLEGETLEEPIHKVFFDVYSFGNAIVELVRTTEENEEGVVEKKLFIYHHQIHTVALEKPGANGVVEHIAISDSWGSRGNSQLPKEEELSILPIYPQWSEKDEEGNQRTAIHIKTYAPGFGLWGLPEWVAARLWAELEYRIPKYNISRFKNGFVPSAIVQFFGAVTREEAKEVIDRFRAQFTDTGNNGKIFAQVLRDERLKANIQTLEDKSDGNYMELQNLSSQAIITGNRWTKSLAGFSTSGQLGSNQQMKDELDFVTNLVIKPQRRQVLQRIVNIYIKEGAKYLEAPALENTQLSIVNMNPISFFNGIDVEANFLVNEKRQKIGLDPLTEEEIGQLFIERNNGKTKI